MFPPLQVIVSTSKEAEEERREQIEQGLMEEPEEGETTEFSLHIRPGEPKKSRQDYVRYAQDHFNMFLDHLEEEDGQEVELQQGMVGPSE